MKQKNIKILKSKLEEFGIKLSPEGIIYIPSNYFGSYTVPVKNPQACTEEEFFADLADFVSVMETDYLAVSTWSHNNPKKHNLRTALNEMENNKKKLAAFIKENKNANWDNYLVNDNEIENKKE